MRHIGHCSVVGARSSLLIRSSALRNSSRIIWYIFSTTGIWQLALLAFPVRRSAPLPITLRVHRWVSIGRFLISCDLSETVVPKLRDTRRRGLSITCSNTGIVNRKTVFCPRSCSRSSRSHSLRYRLCHEQMRLLVPFSRIILVPKGK